MRYWLGPWVWQTSVSPSMWVPPANIIASLDLRSLTNAAATVTPVGEGLFITANVTNLGSDYTNLGTDPDIILTGAQKSSWQSRFNLPNPLAANTLKQALWETITIQSDPTGVDRVPPMIPTTARQYEMWVAGTLLLTKQFDVGGLEAIPLLQTIKIAYRNIRSDCLNGISNINLYRKFLGFLQTKFQVAYQNFIPADLTDEGCLPPETTLSESFATANSTTLGPNLTWTEQSNNSTADVFDIFSNTCRVTGSAGTTASARAESDLSSSDHLSSLNIVSIAPGTGTNEQVGVACRYSSSSQSCYIVRVLEINSQCQICKLVNGTLTGLGSSPTVTVANATPLKLTCNGSSIKSTYNGTDQETITDTSITTGTRCGVFGFTSTLNNSRLDTWAASDLSTGGPFPFFRRTTLIGGLNSLPW